MGNAESGFLLAQHDCGGFDSQACCLRLGSVFGGLYTMLKDQPMDSSHVGVWAK
jgi:hypothetical protein